jgi:hypothetical protein
MLVIATFCKGIWYLHTHQCSGKSCPCTSAESVCSASGQWPKAVKTLLSPPHGIPWNRYKSGQASRFAVIRQPVHQKNHAEVRCKSKVISLTNVTPKRSMGLVTIILIDQWHILFLDIVSIPQAAFTSKFLWYPFTAGLTQEPWLDQKKIWTD